jgi:hypothetical protein
MTTHVLAFVDETDISVRWQCGVCYRETNFPKPGHGEPSATQFQFPENVDAYLDPCPGTYTGQTQRNITRDDFLLRFATTELGAIETSTDVRVKGMYARMMASTMIPLDHPTWASDLMHAEAQGCLDAGRATVIIQ